MTTKLRLSRQRLSAFCSEETTPTSAHSFLLVKGFSLNNVQTSLCLCLGKCSFPEVVEGKGRIILYFAQRDISCSLVQGCTPTLSSPHHQFGPSKIDWLIDLIVELGSRSRSGEGQVRVRWGSGEGQEGQSQVRSSSENFKLKDLDLSSTLFLVCTHPPSTTTNFFLSF